MNKLKVISISIVCIGAGIMLAVNSISIASLCVKNDVGSDDLKEVNLYIYNQTTGTYSNLGGKAISSGDKHCWRETTSDDYILQGVAFEYINNAKSEYYTCCACNACYESDGTTTTDYLTDTDNTPGPVIDAGTVYLTKNTSSSTNCPSSYDGNYDICAKWPLISNSKTDYDFGYCTSGTNESEEACKSSSCCS